MKPALVASCVLMLGVAPLDAQAQNCKPDVSTQDKISKEQTEIWSQVLYKTGLGRSLLGTSEIGITLAVGRYGSENAINVLIQKQEESKKNATFESQYRAQEGNPFVLGFKNGKPVNLVASAVSNESKSDNLVGNLVTTVVLSAVLGDDEIAALREALTTSPIDAFRAQLVGGIVIDQSIDDKNGGKMLSKFTCFFQAMDKEAATRPVVEPAMRPLKVGVDSGSKHDYVAFAPVLFRRSGSFDQSVFSFNSDGTFVAMWDGGTHHGTYRIHGDSLTYQFAYVQGPVKNSKAFAVQLVASGFVDQDGKSWDVLPGQKKAWVAAPPSQIKPAVPQLTTEQVIQMVTAKVPDDVIVASIRNSASKFDLTPELLIKLKKAGVSDTILRAMMR